MGRAIRGLRQLAPRAAPERRAFERYAAAQQTNACTCRRYAATGPAADPLFELTAGYQVQNQQALQQQQTVTGQR